jgi:hypothetical protein
MGQRNPNFIEMARILPARTPISGGLRARRWGQPGCLDIAAQRAAAGEIGWASWQTGGSHSCPLPQTRFSSQAAKITRNAGEKSPGQAAAHFVISSMGKGITESISAAG